MPVFNVRVVVLGPLEHVSNRLLILKVEVCLFSVAGDVDSIDLAKELLQVLFA